MNNDNMGMDDINTLKSNESAFGNHQPGNVEVVLHQQCMLQILSLPKIQILMMAL